jgi:AraC-like DNA-binding protein
MEEYIETLIVLPSITVQLATVSWQGAINMPAYGGYILSQRLSEHHAAIPIGNVQAPEVLSRVRSVGLLPPGCPVRLFPVEHPLSVLLCTFEEEYFERVTGTSRHEWEEHLGSLVTMRNQRLETLMQEILAELQQPGYGQALLVESVATMLVVELARYKRSLDGHASGQRQALAPWQLRAIEERIRTSVKHGYPNLAELAELCGISQGHLTRSFKATTGWQIHAYISSERFNTAKRLLSTAELSCEEVAARLGFKSAAYFSTAFRRATGATPSEFRRNALSENTASQELGKNPAAVVQFPASPLSARKAAFGG